MKKNLLLIFASLLIMSCSSGDDDIMDNVDDNDDNNINLFSNKAKVVGYFLIIDFHSIIKLNIVK